VRGKGVAQAKRKRESAVLKRREKTKHYEPHKNFFGAHIPTWGGWGGGGGGRGKKLHSNVVWG